MMEKVCACFNDTIKFIDVGPIPIERTDIFYMFENYILKELNFREDVHDPTCFEVTRNKILIIRSCRHIKHKLNVLNFVEKNRD